MKNLAIFCIFVTSSVPASATTIFNLNTGILPSLQGFMYRPVGDGANIPESAIFSIVGGELRQNTTGIGLGRPGQSAYFRPSNLAPRDSWSLTLVARVNAFESSLVPPTAYGLTFGGEDSQTNVAIGFGGNSIQYINADLGLTTLPLPIGFDPNAYNTYRLNVRGGLHSFAINGTNIFQGVAYRGSANPREIFFGDGTGFANADVNIRSFVFEVSGAIPEPASWMTMIMGFGMVGGAMRSRQHRRFVRIKA
jgi:hypothetical protein